MKEQQYQNISCLLREHEKLGNLVLLANRIGTRLVYVIYPVLLGSLVLQKDPRLWRELLVPAAAFLLLSAVRDRINAPRPYELYEYTPLIQKESKGNSFPSRHVFSAFVIAMGGFYVNPLIGGVLTVIGIVIAVCRVIGGVHFPKDVLVGAGLGILAGLLGFWAF